jgi:hypothetical protein
MKHLVPGVGYDIYETGDAVSLVIDAAQAADDSHPFKVTISGLKFKVKPGTVNSVMPTLDGTVLDNATAPEKTISASGQVYLECNHTAGSNFPVSVAVKYDTATPSPSTESKLYIHIATINVASGKANKTAQVVKTSLWAEYFKCGSNDPEYYVSQS